MRHGTVHVSKILEHPTMSLRARDHIYSPKHEAKALIDQWLKEHSNVLHRSAPAVKELEVKIEAALDLAYRRGQEG